MQTAVRVTAVLCAYTVNTWYYVVYTTDRYQYFTAVVFCLIVLALQGRHRAGRAGTTKLNCYYLYEYVLIAESCPLEPHRPTGHGVPLATSLSCQMFVVGCRLPIDADVSHSLIAEATLSENVRIFYPLI